MPRAIGSLGHRVCSTTLTFLLTPACCALGSEAATGRGNFDPASFAMGALLSFCVLWVIRLPWGRLAEHIAESLRAWRRNAVMVMFAAALFGVLLLY